MIGPKYRYYVDTSVWGGLFDTEFEAVSRAFFEEIKAQGHVLVVSRILMLELENAPGQVIEHFSEMPQEIIEWVETPDECVALQEAYLKEGVLPAKCALDALHLAIASVHQVDCVVSWNFKHLVNFRRIRLANSVNSRLGYQQIEVMSPESLLET